MNIKKLLAAIVLGSLGLIIWYCIGSFLFALLGWIPDQGLGIALVGGGLSGLMAMVLFVLGVGWCGSQFRD